MAKVRFIILLGLVVLATGKPRESNRRSATSGDQQQWTYELHRRQDSDRVSEAEFFDRLFGDPREDRYAGEYPPFVSLPDYEAGGEEDRLLDEFDPQDPSLDGELSEESSGPDGAGAKAVGKPRDQAKQDGLDNEAGAKTQGSPKAEQPSDKVERNEGEQQEEAKAMPNNRPSGGAQSQAKRDGPIQHHEQRDSERSPLTEKENHPGKPAKSRGNQRHNGERSVGAPRSKDSLPKQEKEHEEQSLDEQSEPRQPSAVVNPRERPSAATPVQTGPQGNPEAPLVQINVNVAPPA